MRKLNEALKLSVASYWCSAFLSILVLIFLGRSFFALTQDRCVIENQLNEPIESIVVLFEGNTNERQHRLVFTDVPAHGFQWDLYNRTWGIYDSSRVIVVEGRTNTGKKIGSEKSLYTPYDLNWNIGLGTRFNIVVQPDGKLKVPSDY